MCLSCSNEIEIGLDWNDGNGAQSFWRDFFGSTNFVFVSGILKGFESFAVWNFFIGNFRLSRFAIYSDSCLFLEEFNKRIHFFLINLMLMNMYSLINFGNLNSNK